MPSAKGWLQRFDEPIPLPEGGELRTLLDASLYIEALPKEKFHRPEWRAATEILWSAAEGKLPVSFASIALGVDRTSNMPGPP